MNTLSFTAPSRWAKGLAMVALAAGAWALSGTAQARDNVYWSVGVNSPGVTLGVSNAPTVVYSHSYPSYGYPVYAPRPVVVYEPRPVVVHRYLVYAEPRWHGHKHHKHWRKHHKHGHDRWDD